MDFGRMPQVDGVDFSLPPDDPRLGTVLPGAPAPLQVWTGCPVIAVHPGGQPRAKPAEPMRTYAGWFPALELNSSFYAVPALGQVERWCAQVPPSFRFCVKVPRSISHGDPAEIPALVAAADAFGPLLGTLFLQLPPHVGPDDHAALQALVRRFPAHLPLAVELRHPGWFWRRRLIGRAFEWMRDRGLHAVITDTPGRRDVSHVSLTTPAVMLRLGTHGENASDLTRMAAWSERFAAWGALGLHTAWAFVHQPESAGLFELAQVFQRIADTKTGAAVKAAPRAPLV